MQCGEPIASAQTSPQPQFSSPETYTPKYLAEKILSSKTALEGERKQITVLFADLKGSMELLADRDPEEARALLDPVLDLMMEAVHRYEGTVNQVMGDGIMALFGAPLAHEDHALRACYAALRMQESVKQYAEEVRSSHGVPVRIRIGVNSGEVVVRSISSDLHMDYTAVGQTTHLAARLEQLADPGSILLTAATLSLVEGYVEVRALGPIPVKGLAAPVDVYEATGAVTVRSRVHAAAVRGLTRFIGRERERDELSRALEVARRGRGQVVAVIGEPGVGKSRCFWEFIRSDRTEGWRILEAAAVSYGRAMAYLPVISLLKTHFQIESRDDQRSIGNKVAGRLLSLHRALEPYVPAFLWLLDVPADDDAWQRLDPPQRRQRALDAVKQLLLRESEEQPLLVSLEDLHWIDGETQVLLDSLVDSLPKARLLLLVNYRPEYQHGWSGKTYYRQIRVDPLPPESADELLEALLGADPTLRPLKRLIIQRTEGNPFFLEESVRALVETHALIGERGAYRLQKPVDSIQVPATVQAVLAARIDRLPPEEKRLLRSAAVIGKDVAFPLLQAIAELSDAEIRRHLAHLQAAEFLYETHLFPELEYTFKHALTHEVAYAGVLQDRRRALHARILNAIEQLYRDRLAEHVERLAHHATRAGAWEKAFTYLREAGVKAFGRSAHRQAVDWFGQAREALSHLPERQETLEWAIDLRFDLRNSLLPLGEHERYVDCLREAQTIATRLGDQHRLGWVAAYMTAYLYLMGDQTRAVESGERALAIARVQKDFSLKISATTWLGQAYYYRGDYVRAIGFFKSNVESLVGTLIGDRLGLPQLPSVHSRTCLVWCFAELGRFEEGLVAGKEGLEIAEAAEHPLSLVVACAGLGILHLRKGDFPQAIPLLERGLKLSEAWSVRLWFPRLASALGTAYAMSGRIPDALPLLTQAVQQADSMKLMGGHSFLVASLSEAYLLAGRTNEAAQLARLALDRSRAHQERGYEAWTLRLLAEVAWRVNPADLGAVEGYCRAALALAEDLSMRPLVAHVHLAIARVYRSVGQHAVAEEHLITATTLFREMDMPAWSARPATDASRRS